jgi:CBS-domain-containing membrane protein
VPGRCPWVHLPSQMTRISAASWTAADVMLTEVRMVPGDVSVQSAWDESHSGGAATLLVGTPARLIGTVHAQQVVAAVESGR